MLLFQEHQYVQIPSLYYVKDCLFLHFLSVLLHLVLYDYLMTFVNYKFLTERTCHFVRGVFL